MKICLKPKINTFIIGRVYLIYGKGYLFAGINKILRIELTDKTGLSCKIGE